MNAVFINKSIWNNFTPTELDEYISKVFKYYRKVGFPYFKSDMEYRNNEFRKLTTYDFKRVIGDGVIGQSMHGLALAWSYMSHSWGVTCNDKLTPLDAFNDDILFKKVIAKRIKMGDNISDNGIRKMLKIFSGVQSVSNFRPTAAAAIYSKYCEPNDVVWDMSAGFGGRLLGAKLANVYYIGTEPSTETFNGLIDMQSDFEIDGELHKIGSEVYNPISESLDFCFTSPPYFNTEKYSNELSQSYLKFPTKEDWVENYLTKTFKLCYTGLKFGKVMAINIANVPSFNDLEEVTIRCAISVGFKHVDTLKLALSNVAMKSGKSNFKYEPIFIFKKVDNV